MSPIIEDRLELVNRVHLKSGAHAPDSTFCAMEMYAYVRGEPWSDHSDSMPETIGAFIRSWNDGLPNDADRDRLLKPLLLKVAAMEIPNSPELEERRSLMAADWLVRVNAPAWLRLAGLTVHADALAALPEITSMAQVLKKGETHDRN